MVEEVAKEAVQGGVLGTLGINLKLFIAQLINFGVILLVLWRFAYRPLLKIMNDRKKTIEEGLENAKKAESNLMMAEAAYKKKLDEAVDKANKMVGDAEKKSDAIVDAARTKAKTEVEKIVNEARQKIQEEKVSMQNEVKAEVVELVFTVAEKVLGKKMDDKKDAELVEKLTKGV